MKTMYKNYCLFLEKMHSYFLSKIKKQCFYYNDIVEDKDKVQFMVTNEFSTNTGFFLELENLTTQKKHLISLDEQMMYWKNLD